MAQLRESLAEVGRALAKLLRSRRELAAEVKQSKAERGPALLVRDVEETVERGDEDAVVAQAGAARRFLTETA